MNNLVIIGGGGFGREVLQWAKDSIGYQKEFCIKGFIDDDIHCLDGLSYDSSLFLGKLSEYQPLPNDIFICAIGNPVIKKKIVEDLSSKGAFFTNIIHNTALVGNNVSYGIGTILCPNVVLTCDILIGEHVSINVNTVLGHDVKLGSYIQVSCSCDINGYVIIEDDVFIGGKSSILPSNVVGKGSIIGAGSLCNKNIPPHVTVAGLPAKIIARR